MSPGKVCCLRGVGIYKKSPVGRCCLTGLVGGGGYLLFHFRSIIGVVRFNFSVRNGKRWSPHAIATLVLFRSDLHFPMEVVRRIRSERVVEADFCISRECLRISAARLPSVLIMFLPARQVAAFVLCLPAAF